jgi:hypothetical protein
MSGQSRRKYAALAVTALALMFGAPGATLPGQAQGHWPFVIQWEHDGDGVAYYQVCISGQCTYLDALRGEGTRWRAPLPILPRGEHRVVLQACGYGGGCIAGTPDLMVRVLAPSPRRPPIDVQPIPPPTTTDREGRKP